MDCPSEGRSRYMAIYLSWLGVHLSVYPRGDLFTCLKSVCWIVISGLDLSEWWLGGGGVSISVFQGPPISVSSWVSEWGRIRYWDELAHYGDGAVSRSPPVHPLLHTWENLPSPLGLGPFLMFMLESVHCNLTSHYLPTTSPSLKPWIL